MSPLALHYGRLGQLFDDYSAWAPDYTRVSEADRYRVLIDLPGVAKDDISVEHERGRVRVSGERAQPNGENVTVVRSGASYGKFELVFALPENADAERIEVALENGVLTLTVPKAEGSRVRRLSIKS